MAPAQILKGRLGLETARIPHADRHGLIYLERGTWSVADGTLRFTAAAGPVLDAGDHALPFQAVSIILIGPGSTVSHDALRLLARHGTALVAVGEGGVRLYSAPQIGPDDSRLARRQARVWADAADSRILGARRMFAWRFGEVLPHMDIAALRGIEGSRLKESYRLIAQRHGVTWSGRRYDRANPNAADLPNQAISHAATAVEAAALVAVAATATISQLGFIHEDSASAFVLGIADLLRTEVTLPLAFAAAKEAQGDTSRTVGRIVRRRAGDWFRRKGVIPAMIDRIKELFDGRDRDP